MTTTRSTNDVPTLTTRDVEALLLLAEGLSTAEIADAMALSTNTVRTKVRRLGAKLGAAGREDVVARARELGVV